MIICSCNEITKDEVVKIIKDFPNITPHEIHEKVKGKRPNCKGCFRIMNKLKEKKPD